MTASSSSLRERLQLALDQLTINGYKALPCGVCKRYSIALGVNDLAQLLTDVIAALAPADPPAADPRDAEIAALREALRTYGHHQERCALRSTSKEVWPECSCGFSHALSAGVAADPPRTET